MSDLERIAMLARANVRLAEAIALGDKENILAKAEALRYCLDIVGEPLEYPHARVVWDRIY